MERVQPRAVLVLDEFYAKRPNWTALTVAEFGSGLDRGDVVCEVATRAPYELAGWGFRPKCPTADGVLRSELSRANSTLIQGRVQASLVGRFLIHSRDNFRLWHATVRIEAYANPAFLVREVPIVAETRSGCEVDRARGILILRERPAGDIDPTPNGDFYLFLPSDMTPGFTAVTLGLASRYLAKEPIFSCSLEWTRGCENMIAMPISWRKEA
jgi:hypothetical protein